MLLLHIIKYTSFLAMSSDDDNNDNPTVPTIPPELSRKLLQVFAPTATTKRIPNDTAAAVSEVLRKFVLEARARASIEAECDKEGEALSSSSSEDEDGSNHNNKEQSKTEIRGEHITKTAANLLMDFS